MGKLCNSVAGVCVMISLITCVIVILMAIGVINVCKFGEKYEHVLHSQIPSIAEEYNDKANSRA